MAQETYFYGQGQVDAAPIVNGVVGKWRWIQDVSAMAIQLAVDKVEHKESYSGQKALVRSFPIGKTATINMTLHSISPDNLALTLYGKVVTKAAGTVTAEPLPGALVAGDVVALANPGVTDLVITDSAATPVELDEQYYALLADGAYGEVQILSLPTPAPTQPFKAAYGYAATKQVGMFTAPQPTIALRYKGINLAEGGAPVIVELYKVATDPLQELALINDGNAVAGMQISGGILLDSSRPASDDLGQFGRIIQLG
ncbi:hypothetical protein QO207_10340 [Pseudomonas sp. CAN2814]|uniref:phage tail tube protein n=1 Tax=Pseudomonas sp. CAN1 TaxID=3046726 RepID=UPI0026496C1A|nr:hypothetical protein [Pseudomonas sp. CAN1]MDN6856986.1 hypothetical protein [Pseudomonas sp. CAN1]